MYSYNGFSEIDGVFVPVPGLCHPALTEVADFVRSIAEDYFQVPIVPALTAAMADPDSTSVDPPLQTLRFTRSRVIGERWDGADISWDVWIDQYGRAISSTSYAMN